MPQPIRTFIAVPLRATRPIREALEALRGMGRALKPVYEDSLHVTLKFLGDTAPDLIPRLHQEIVAAVGEQPAFDLRLTGMGGFPHAERPRVVWAGLDGADPLVRIAGELEQRIAPLGFPTENRPFQPHLTLARLRSRPPRELAPLLQTHAATDFGTVRATSVILYQSELRTHGPRYTPLATVDLGE